MTPKEKAKEIYCKYTDALNIRDLQITANPFAKKCALIAADEMVIFLIDLDAYYGDAMINFWQEVKSEIEKL